MTQDLIKRYGGAAPRYTSYPTAPHFNAGVGEDAYRARLASLPQEPISLYVHIPFCDTLCWFCGCHTKITRRYEPVADYVDTLISELAELAHAATPDLSMSHMHWGGGSPTLLTPKDTLRLARVATALFAPAQNYEFAIEIDPRETGIDRIAALAEAGLTRASIGVQDFDPQVQQAINRLQSFEETAAAANNLKEFGVKSLNLDLMYGLPYQTLARTLQTIEQALTLRPDRVALFGYAHVPWMKTHQRLIPEDALPGPEARKEAADAAAELLIGAGYLQIGIDHFALPDDSLSQAEDARTLRRNFQGYTTDQAKTLLPVGASSIGRLPDMFIQNEPSLKSHAKRVTEGHLPISKGVLLSMDDQLRATIIERLMCDFSVDLSATCTLFGADITSLSDAFPRLKQMQEDGLLNQSKGTITVTETGKPYIRQIAACFDQYFSQGTARHSSTV
ncbi:MAG: oxygen-independent coproporphyrinogen III oxidase [Alphaproteobacteria bacterium]|nr:oxygen-independent coproporphyrinogen III oxidase [Alphaproteobacteria bacterium]